MADNKVISELERIANEQRKVHISRNDYDLVGEYGSTHQDAISDGDEKGKGENDDKIGSSDDINARTKNLVKNDYQKEKQYGVNHQDAISDGDEKGKGENDGKVGSAEDIKERTFVIARNAFNDKNTYPNFE